MEFALKKARFYFVWAILFTIATAFSIGYQSLLGTASFALASMLALISSIYYHMRAHL